MHVHKSEAAGVTSEQVESREDIQYMHPIYVPKSFVFSNMHTITSNNVA